MVLLHGFPQFWWTWRAQLPALAAAGLHAVAPDLRGYGASDKPPRGYDLPTAAADVAALIRALGERDAVLVGPRLGCARRLDDGRAAPAQRPPARRPVDGPPPAAARRDGRPGAAPGVPLLPRRPAAPAARAAAHPRRRRPGRRPDARAGRGPEWTHTPDFAEAVDRYRAAARIPQAAYGSMEYFRWAGRSQLRPDGLRYARRMAAPDHGAHAPAARRGRQPACCPPRRRARAATSPAPTSCARCPASATSRRRRHPGAVGRRDRRLGAAAESLAGAGVDRRGRRRPVRAACVDLRRGQRVAGRGSVIAEANTTPSTWPLLSNSGPPELPARTSP